MTMTREEAVRGMTTLLSVALTAALIPTIGLLLSLGVQQWSPLARGSSGVAQACPSEQKRA